MLQEQQQQIEHQHIIRKSSEPGVINDELVKYQLCSHGYGGELAPLGRNASIDYATITELYLDFQNILQIDNLWMCFSLTKLSLKCNKLAKIQNLDNLQRLRELDLSFNNIERIENLECLQCLEYLTLYKNDIRKIENLQLTNLMRLNLGWNFIDSIDGIETLRDNGKLFSLNLLGNPICDKYNDNGGFRLFIAAYLPNLRYYGYHVIANDERNKGQEIYKNKLRSLGDREMEQINMRQRQLRCAQLALVSSESFVENLDDHQLFEELFTGTVENNDDTYKREYRRRIYGDTQEVYRRGLECRDQRIIEIKLFDEALAHGRKAAQHDAIQLVNRCSNIATTTASNATAIAISRTESVCNSLFVPLAKPDEKTNRQQHNLLDERYEARFDSIWYVLMELETTLHERITESKTIFFETISQIIENFIEKCSESFECMQTACENYFQSIEPADGHSNDETMAKDHHSSIIDRRMDKIQSLANKWLLKVIDQYEQDEYNRNRNRIMEINAIVEAERSNYNQLNSSL